MSITIEDAPIRVGEGAIGTTLYRSDEDGGAILLFAPGAGAPRSHVFMTTVAAAIATAGVHVRTLDFAYTTAGKKMPDRMPKLVDTYRAVLDDTCERLGGVVVVGGKSMGSRVACTIATTAHGEGIGEVRGVVSLGYPLAPKGREKERAPREALLVGTPLPHLVVQGARDEFGGDDVMPAVVAKASRARLVIVPHADHAFEMPARDRGARSPGDVWTDVGVLVAAFVKELAAGT